MKQVFIIFMFLTTVYAMKAQESTASKNVSHFTIDAPQLGVQKKIWVYLPDNYNENNKKFPVIYMHDAQNLFDRNTSYSGEWRADEVLDSLHAKVIVIGIEHGNDKRGDELTPYLHEKYGGGKADAYLDFIVNILKPYVDKTYRTKDGNKHTAIMGSSLGGLVSYYAVLKYPKVFGKAGVFSPSFWWSEDIYDLTIKTDKIPARLYFMAGDHESKDMVPDMERMIELIKPKLKSEKDIHVKVSKGGKHNEALWSKELADALVWLLD
jgi:predicted alpha/beta superfamily hydrolase